MKKKYITFIVLITFFPALVFSEDGLDKKFREILTRLDKIIARGSNNELSKKLKIIQEKSLKGELSFHIDKKMGVNIFSGAGFTPKGKNSKETFIAVSPALIQAYDDYPSIVLSIIVHEMAHAYSYFKDPGYFIFYSDKNVDKYLYEFDALYYEAYFINKYLRSTRYKLTLFEEHLNRCYKNNEVHVFSRYYHTRDYQTAFAFYKIRTSNKSINDKFSDIEKLAEKVLAENKSNSEDTEEVRFKKIIIMLTCFNFLPQTVFDILEMDDKTRVKAQHFYLQKYPALYRLNSQIGKAVNKKDIDFCYMKHKEFHNAFVKIK